MNISEQHPFKLNDDLNDFDSLCQRNFHDKEQLRVMRGKKCEINCVPKSYILRNFKACRSEGSSVSFSLISEQGVKICSATITSKYNKDIHTETSMLKKTYETGN